MRGAALPAALLCVALGIMLGFAPRRAILPGALLLIAAAVPVALFAALPLELVEPIFLGCWLSVIVTAASIYLPRKPGLQSGTAASIPFVPRYGLKQIHLGLTWALILAADAGLFAGGVIAAEGTPPDLVRTLPWVLVALPASWAARSPARIGLKILTSWLIAVAVLAALLPLAPTPGYVPDHME